MKISFFPSSILAASTSLSFQDTKMFRVKEIKGLERQKVVVWRNA